MASFTPFLSASSMRWPSSTEMRFRSWAASAFMMSTLSEDRCPDTFIVDSCPLDVQTLSDEPRRVCRIIVHAPGRYEAFVQTTKVADTGAIAAADGLGGH